MKKYKYLNTKLGHSLAEERIVEWTHLLCTCHQKVRGNGSRSSSNILASPDSTPAD